jgi:hypothetical protein
MDNDSVLPDYLVAKLFRVYNDEARGSRGDAA